MQTLISMKEVTRRTSLSRTSISKARQAGNFPKEIQLSEKRIGFVSAEIDEWIAQRIAARNDGMQA